MGFFNRVAFSIGVVAAMAAVGCAEKPPAARPTFEPSALENTLEKLRRLRRGDKAVPPGFSQAESAALADGVRRCWREDLEMTSRTQGWSVSFIASYDQEGRVQKVTVDEDKARLDDARYRAFAERAAQTLREEPCSTLILPAALRGKPGALRMKFGI